MRAAAVQRTIFGASAGPQRSYAAVMKLPSVDKGRWLGLILETIAPVVITLQWGFNPTPVNRTVITLR